MGIEYFIEIPDLNSDLIEKILRSSPFFRMQYELNDKTNYEFRLELNNEEMPNTVAIIEDNGLYICDFGCSEEIMRLLLNEIKLQYLDTELKELE